jgi:hypothetical protein
MLILAVENRTLSVTNWSYLYGRSHLRLKQLIPAGVHLQSQIFYHPKTLFLIHCLAISTNKPPFRHIHESCLSGGQSHGINYVTNTFDFIGGPTAKSQLRDLLAIIQG